MYLFRFILHQESCNATGKKRIRLKKEEDPRGQILSDDDLETLQVFWSRHHLIYVH